MIFTKVLADFFINVAAGWFGALFINPIFKTEREVGPAFRFFFSFSQVVVFLTLSVLMHYL